ncbi:hypothetical protein [Novosphingobium sp. Gsoil 351]|uniref:hypothetical protein n=1 Tax=Novosphingobium sp. Gsoil 351 TaxID=2675225 RepID=UPI0012B4DA26|nr:hypothetical protein [Novosphingobium sp. Gsoil 351]QGN55972.1 hypothetical protein GKE62_16840 [Novosphingobium sp. Gsoil 351]
MTRTLLLLSSVTLLALSACSQPAPAPEPDASEAAPAETAGSPVIAEPTATAAPSPEESTVADATIPAAAQGRWGLVPADCTSTKGDAKGLLTIDATTLKFYESRGALANIAERSDTRLRAAFTFSGEGMTWSRDEVLDVQDGGKTLIRREYGEDAAPGPFKYARCPAT